MTLFILWLATAPIHAAEAAWETLYTEDGVTVSKREIADSPLVAFKGEAVMDAPLTNVLNVLMDHGRRVEWVDRLYISTVLEETSQHEYVLYQAYELPVIFSNRDYVYRGLAVQDASSGVVSLDLHSVEHADAPPTIGVRAHLVDSRYVLTPISDEQCRIAVEIHTDPKGWMPAWLVNMIQESWPLKTLNGVRSELARPEAGPYPLPPPS